METLLQDLRHSVRSLLRAPGLFALATFSLALGVAANTTVFSAADVFLFRPLPYPDGERLVDVRATNVEANRLDMGVSIPDFIDWRAEARTIDVAAYYDDSFNLSATGAVERVEGARISSNLMRVLGARPVAGRAPLDDEEAVGGGVLVISTRLWQRRFGGRADVVGSTVTVNGEPRTIIGIMPEDFRFPGALTDVWAPLEQTGTEARASRFASVVARLAGGATIDGAASELSAIAGRLEQAHPADNHGIGVRLVALRDAYFDNTFRTAAMISTAAVAFVLLIACANIANLLLARAASREREIAVRTALGAGRGRILRQLLTESMVLAIAGGAIGTVLSYWGNHWLVSLFPASVPFLDRVGIDGRVLAFTLLVTVGSGLLFGLAPALEVLRPDLGASLRDSGARGSTTGVRRGRFRGGLVAVEIGLALVLLISSGLLVRGFIRLRTTDPGFDPAGVLTARISLLERDYPDSVSVGDFEARLMARLRALPGVRAAAATTGLPMRGGSATYYSIGGAPVDADTRRPTALFRQVTPDYFDALGVAVRRGRAITDADGPGAAPVAVVNEAFARRHWPGGNAVGERIVLTSGEREIVGVVGDTRDYGVDDDAPPVLYLALAQRTSRDFSVVLRADGEPGALAGALRREVSALDPQLPVYRVLTMDEIVTEDAQGDMIMVRLLGVFAAIALLLAVMGVYGVMSHAVAQRTREMGIRMALGAHRGDILGLVLRQGVVLAAIGLGAGVLIALAVARFLSSFLYGVSPFDVLTFATMTAALAAAALIATLVPARRATRVDPVTSLRAQ